MMTKEGSTQIVDFMTSGAGVLVLGRGHKSHTVKMHDFFQNLLPTPRHRSDILQGWGTCVRAWEGGGQKGAGCENFG